MSTKVYNAYRLSSLCSLEKLTVWLHKLRKDHFEYVIHKMKSNVVWKNDYDAMRKQYVEVSQKMEQFMEAGYNEDLNFQASVVVIPYKKEIYIKFYLGDYMDEVVKTRFFKKNMRDFHYQNSTDRPKDISASEWTHRRRVWDSIGELGRALNEMGFVFDIFSVRTCHEVFWKIDDELMDRFNIESQFRKKVAVGEKA